MGFYFDIKTIPSEKNGKIVVQRVFNNVSIYVDGYDQSSKYIAEMWRKALYRVPEEHPVKHVLILGLAAGNAVREMSRRFHDAHITVVEWDPAMVELAKHLRQFSKKTHPEIIIGDAAEVVPKMQQKFDLILVDLFTGETPEPRLASAEMIDALARILKSDGYLILNPFKNVALIPAFERKLSRQSAWHYRFNALALFRHYGQGHAGDRLPEGFVHQMQSRDYLLGGWDEGAKNVEMVGKPGCLGMRWHYGPFWIEAYTTDAQPEIDRTAHSRLVIWQPIAKLGKPAGWHRSWIQMNSQQHAFGDLRGKTEYWKEWTENAQRNRRKWLKNGQYEIVEVSIAAFAEAYHKTGKLPMIRKDFIRLLERRMVRHGDDVHLFGARDKQTGQIISGLAVCDLPETSTSMHLIAFTHPKFEKTGVGTGVIDAWYEHCLATGIRFPHFGLVWAPGDPGGWKGYSKFKRQFNLFLLLYPRPLIRFVRQRKS